MISMSLVSTAAFSKNKGSVGLNVWYESNSAKNIPPATSLPEPVVYSKEPAWLA
jgi:hypothetical protein